jgi:NAD(P)-dependent dehydrogenase (short-subunit alcohol dehydrogenase family)
LNQSQPYEASPISGRGLVTISSLAGQLDNVVPVPMTVYGSPKAGLHYITRNRHKDYHASGLIAFPIPRGLVDTDTRRPSSIVYRADFQFTVAPAESAASVIKVINNACHQQSGRFWSHTEKNWNGDQIKI